MGWLATIPITVVGAGYYQLMTAPRQLPIAQFKGGEPTSLISANGVVQPAGLVNVSPKMSGVLKKIIVAPGDYVEPGQIVAYMDSFNLQEQLVVADSNLSMAQVNLSTANTSNRSPAISRAQSQVTAARHAVAIVERKIRDTVVRAPFAGIVSRKYAGSGELVASAAIGTPVTSTSSLILSLVSTNEILAQVAESIISQIHVGQVVIIRVDAYIGKTFEGRVTAVATHSLVQKNITSFEVRVAILNSQRLLHQGMNVIVDFNQGV